MGVLLEILISVAPVMGTGTLEEEEVVRGRGEDLLGVGNAVSVPCSRYTVRE
jgi:hypothetical protein